MQDLHLLLSGLDHNGIRGVAQKLNVSTSAVHKWVKVGFIPDLRLEELEQLFDTDEKTRHDLKSWCKSERIKLIGTSYGLDELLA